MAQRDVYGKNTGLKWKFIKLLDKTPTWIKGLKVDDEVKMVHVWDATRLSFYSFPGFEHMHTYTEMATGQDELRDVLFIPRYGYFAACTKEGRLSVLKLCEGKELII